MRKVCSKDEGEFTLTLNYLIVNSNATYRKNKDISYAGTKIFNWRVAIGKFMPPEGYGLFAGTVSDTASAQAQHRFRLCDQCAAHQCLYQCLYQGLYQNRYQDLEYKYFRFISYTASASTRVIKSRASKVCFLSRFSLVPYSCSTRKS